MTHFQTYRFFILFALFFCIQEIASGQNLFSSFNEITPLARGAENAIIADMDNDNDQDVLYYGYYDLAWFVNNGNGNFGHNRNIIDTNKVLIEVKDYDSDGDMDILAKSPYTNSNFYMYINNSEGEFSRVQILGLTGITGGVEIFTGNLDGDNLLDVVVSVSSTNTTTYVYEGQIGGTFSIVNTIQSCSVAAMIDIDTDGDKDLITNAAQVYKNNGLGNFTLENIPGIGYVELTLVNFSDIDNDNDIDIIGLINGATLDIRVNDGTGSFSTQCTIAVGTPYNILITEVKTKDLDGDNDSEIMLILSNNDNDFIIYKNNGGNNFTSTQYIVANAFDGLSAIDAGDLDGDNDNDVLYVSRTQSKIIWKKNNGSGVLGTERYITQACSSVYDVEAIDIDFDQDLDIIVASLVDNQVIAYINDGIGNGFTEQQVFANIHRARELSTGDFNNDGHKDIVVGYYDEYPMGKLAFIISNGTGYNPPVSMNMNSTYPWTLITSDLDQDGKLDVIAVTDEGIVWYRSQGNSFTKHVLNAVSGDIKLAVADMDNDQDLDIVTYKDPVLWLENQNNTFNNIHPIMSSSYFWDLALFDEDNDGDIDVTIKLVSDSTVTIQNDGSGNFALNSWSGPNGQNFAAADFDNDGDIDFVRGSTAPLPPALVTYEETEGNTIIMHNIYRSSSYNEIEKFDLDNDGDLDILAYSTSYADYGNGIAWAENLSTNPTLSGIAYYDSNQNGQYDTGDYPLNNQTIVLNPSAVVSYTTNNGYSYVLDGGNQSVSINPDSGWHSTSYSSVNFTLTAAQDTIINFGVYPNTVYPNIKPYLTSNINRCSQTVPYYLSVVNEGTSIEPLSVVVLTPDTLLNYVSATPAPDSIGIDGKLYWHINALLPTQQHTFTIFFQIPNFNSMGNILHTNADVFSYNNANTQTNHNDFQYQPIVVCSYDPNDKSVTPAGEQNEHYTLIGSELFYTIRFQNTGNDTAFNIVVRDTLSENLNWNTFRPITSSHQMQTIRNSNGVVEFKFDNILLPDSTTNEPASHGFVLYAVVPQNGLPSATVINNTANIYFDSNPPIITNTTHNQMVNQIPCNIPTPLFISGNDDVCNGYTEVYSVPYVAGATYNWSVERGIIISGNGTNQVTILWQDPSMGGIITVNAVKY